MRRCPAFLVRILLKDSAVLPDLKMMFNCLYEVSWRPHSKVQQIQIVYIQKLHVCWVAAANIWDAEIDLTSLEALLIISQFLSIDL